MSPASVKVDGKETGAIDKGLIVYLGVGPQDTAEDISWLARKMVNLRIFSDEEGKMNKSLRDIEGGILLISQFTLFASTKKGNRPSYLGSAPPQMAQELYNNFQKELTEVHGVPIGTGIFAADMHVTYTNHGPVTIVMDTKQKS